MATWFIADLHLSPARPDITALFQHFLEHQARHAEALYILGDLFDVWIGDDDTSDFATAVQAALRQLTQSGGPVYFMAGNRDFLIGKRFAQQTGVQILTEPTLIDLYGTPTLLLHGDTLCTDDVSYQRFRKVIRHPVVQRLLLCLPLRTRMSIAQRLRATSKTQQPLTEEQLKIMDANPQAVQNAFMQYQVRQMIHGHTHRPAIHQYSLPQGQIAERIVVGDWYTQGSLLKVTPATRDLLVEPLQ